MPRSTTHPRIAVAGIDIGKNTFHVVGHDKSGAIVLRQKWSRGQVESCFANMPPCLVGMEACVGAHHRARTAAAATVTAQSARAVRHLPGWRSARPSCWKFPTSISS